MRIILFYCIFFILNPVVAQHKNVLTEKEYSALKDEIRLNLNANVDTAIVQAYQMAKSNNYKHLAFANGALSYLVQMKGKNEQSQEKYRRALYYLEKMPDSRDKIQMKSYLYNYRGLAEWNRRNFGAAIENYQEGIKLSEEIDDTVQIFKFNANIALVNESVGNYELAIKTTKKLKRFLDQHREIFTKDDFINKNSNLNLAIASAYESYFMQYRDKMYLLDSAEYYYNKTLKYSDKYLHNRVTSKLSLGNIYNFRHDFKNAEKMYKEVQILAAENDLKDLSCVSTYNLADIYYTTQKYDEALLFYKKSDSIAEASNLNQLDFLKSNYYQSKIYNILGKPELAHKHSKIFLDNYEKFETKLNEETAKVNFKQGIDKLSAEMASLDEEYKKQLFFDKYLKLFYAFLLVAIITIWVKFRSDKRKAYKKMHSLIQEFKGNVEKNNESGAKLLQTEYDKQLPKKENVCFNLDQNKEDSIVESLLQLEEDLEYLNVDFTLSFVAKKINTNTTYLSYVVNKRFGKSFSEYTNELKINYAINKMITNDKYRKNSTQTTAESVGFKNAGSFAKSFRKRTGVSPVQFANNI